MWAWLCPNRTLSMKTSSGGMDSIETCILPYLTSMTSPSLMQEQGTQSRCAGTTQRDGMEREVGGGFRTGDTGTPVADSCQCMAKPTTIF